MSKPLAEDGERFLPAYRGAIRYEHLHRYALCLPYVGGRRVIDVASGEGYGSALLAQKAASVEGIDISADAVAHARLSYQSDNLNFQVANATELPNSDASVDVVISFETIEHISDHVAFIAEIRRVLVPDGVLIISSPNRAMYSDGSGYENPFHVHELYISEFDNLLRRFFNIVSLFGQRLLATSVVSRIDCLSSGSLQGLHGSMSRIERGIPAILPMYAIAICSNSAIRVDEAESFYLDDEQDLFVETKSDIDRAFELVTRARARADLAQCQTEAASIDLTKFTSVSEFKGSLDIIEDGRSGVRVCGPFLVGNGSTYMLSGWVLLHRGAADTIVITINDLPSSVGTSTGRPDVAAVFGETAGFAGFSALVKINHSPGIHKMEVIALDRVGMKRCCIAMTNFIVAQTETLESTHALHFDPPTRNGVVLDADEHSITEKDLVMIRGWGIDVSTKSPLHAAALLIDGKTIVSIPYGEDRSDVAQAYGLSQSKVGIKVEILGDAFGVGMHQVQLLGVVERATDVMLVSDRPIRINVRSA